MAVTRVVAPGQIAALLAKTDKRIRRGVHEAVVEAAAVGAEIVAKDAPVDTGRLKQSVVMRKKGPSGGPEIIAQAPYAGPVEVGSRPHWVPLRPLVGWVRRHVMAAAREAGIKTPGRVGTYKGRTARAFAAYNRRSRARNAFVDEILKMARLIQRAIARRGTKPRYFMRKNLPRLGQILLTLLRESKARTVAGLGGP